MTIGQPVHRPIKISNFHKIRRKKKGGKKLTAEEVPAEVEHDEVREVSESRGDETCTCVHRNGRGRHNGECDKPWEGG